MGGSSIPYEGYVELPFQVEDNVATVPFLVMKQCIEDPIIGFNVIMMLSSNGDNKDNIYMIKTMSCDDLDEGSSVALIDVLESANEIYHPLEYRRKEYDSRSEKLPTFDAK